MIKINNIPIENFQSILFDFDGVLAECMDVKTEAFAQMFEQYGEEIVKKVVNHHITNGGISRYVKFKHYHKEFLNHLLSDDEINNLAKKFSDLVVEKVISSPWVPGAKEFLEKYYKKIDMYIISGTPEEELREIVKERKMQYYFKGIYGAPYTKPVIIQRIIKENKYDPEKIIYIGDSYSDYENALELKIPFLGRRIPNKKSPFPEIIKSIYDFNDLIK